MAQLGNPRNSAFLRNIPDINPCILSEDYTSIDQQLTDSIALYKKQSIDTAELVARLTAIEANLTKAHKSAPRIKTLSAGIPTADELLDVIIPIKDIIGKDANGITTIEKLDILNKISAETQLDPTPKFYLSARQ